MQYSHNQAISSSSVILFGSEWLRIVETVLCRNKARLICVENERDEIFVYILVEFGGGTYYCLMLIIPIGMLHSYVIHYNVVVFHTT